MEENRKQEDAKINIDCTFPAPAASCHKREGVCPVFSQIIHNYFASPRSLFLSPPCKLSSVTTRIQIQIQNLLREKFENRFCCLFETYLSVGPCDIVCRGICE